HLEQRLDVLDRLLEQLQTFVATLRLHPLQSLVKDALGSAALALPHHGVDKLGHQVRAIYGIGRNGPFSDMSFSRHQLLSSLRSCPGFKFQGFNDASFPGTLKRETLRLAFFIPSSPVSLRT